jgi:SAM-dependent methyltransferase
MTHLAIKLKTCWAEFKGDLIKFNLKNLLYKLLKMEIWLISQILLNRWVLDFEKRSISSFIQRTAAAIPGHAHILDAGAGNRPYAHFFTLCHYESCDLSPNVLGPGFHDFHCDLSEAIPRPEATYDAVIATQVLEHLQDPRQAIKEFYRVLKPGGALILTCPQGGPLHEEPHHYFNFTIYGLELLFKQAGFKTIAVKARGGYFRVLGFRCMNLFYMLSNQKDLGVMPIISFILLAPVVQPVLAFIIPILSLLLDPLDYEKKLTLGYACLCHK